MKSFRFRLTAIILTLIAISVIAAGLTMGQIFKESHIRALEENMAREINLLRSTFDFHSISSESTEQYTAYYTEKAKELSDVINSRITFINKEGTVIGDSEMDVRKMDNHALRDEIRQAEEDGVGSAIRYSDTLKQNMLYVAEPVKSESGFDGYIRVSMSLQAVDEGMHRAWMAMIIGLVLLFLIASVISYRIASNLTSPLEHITKVANRISKLDYDARVALQRNDEVGQLAAAINGMADSLQMQMKTIRDNEDLLQRVMSNMTGGILMIDANGKIALVNRETERMLGISSSRVTGKPYYELKQHYELTKLVENSIQNRERMHEEVSVFNPGEHLILLDGVPMQDEASYRGMLFLLQDVTAIRRLENMRSEFVANVSHELKTPIAAVKGFAETLLGGGVKDEETARSFLQIIYDESERLNRLIGDILELSKIESKRSPLECEPVHLSSFFDMLNGTLARVAEKKHISLQMDVPEELFIEADEDKLKQIFLNLISNGINYTQEGGIVKLKVKALLQDGEPERVVFSVIDTGIGIPKKDLPRIFERFYRVDKGRSRNSGGTGLGLSIVKHLVELHHGTVTVDSELGLGTTFKVELPLLQQDEDQS
ncbi:cell wall metabolism sensor histidine kinase WalK [Paenibacillus sp. P96]|uniref:histidine kinase n=1 Tax=Paenibacillus zeirhizosphaerae TaxID=2987519 RepID=A0ABT9FTP9_9BACL|nr:ATP-binding protein [Paenibacillus sp. P96]MDP4097871.1 cell wall metabolism sensor histidine kinase WalK [Paenibacillus sp. P96]